MFSKFLPDYYLPSSLDLCPAFFLQKGIRAIISDIDNTLVTYDDAEPTDAVYTWLKALERAGICVLFVSNNNHERVATFNASLGYYATAKSHKPGKKAMEAAISAAMKRCACTRDEICMLGDQIFTDVYAAKKCGLRAILVPPIRDKRDPFTRFKRLLERPILRKFRKLQAKSAPLHFAVLGDPIAHSRSPLLHKTLGDLCGISLTYEAIRTGQDELAHRMQALKEAGYCGFNCTMPLKTDAFLFSTKTGEAAQSLQTVNTVTPLQNGFFGDTTDGLGFVNALRHHGVDPKGKKVVLLGAGGAARSVCDALLIEGAELCVLNRTQKQCGAVLAQVLTDASLKAACADCDILVQATSLGMEGQADFSDLSFVDTLPAHAVVADLVYHPLETSLLAYAKARGLFTVDGLWMLLFQGIASFTIWHGIAPNKEIASKTYDVLRQSFEDERK